MDSASNSICFVGIGLVTAVGLNAAAIVTVVRAGISGFQEHLFMINHEGDLYSLAIVSLLGASLFSSRVWQKETINRAACSNILEKEEKAPS